MSLAVGLTLASTAWGIGSSIHARNKQKKAKRQRAAFFDREINPILEDMQSGIEDVDFGSIRDAELKLPAARFQNQMREISRGRESSLGGSGFQGSGFIESDFQNQANLAGEEMRNQTFNIDRGIIDMQSQLEAMINENRLRAKELEFSYKYG